MRLQGDMSATRKFGGTGLGLNITKSLIEAHGGSITVESVKGSRHLPYTLHLPWLHLCACRTWLPEHVLCLLRDFVGLLSVKQLVMMCS